MYNTIILYYDGVIIRESRVRGLAAKAQKKKKAAGQRSFSVILFIAAVLLVGYFSVSIIQSQVEISRQEQAVAQLQEQIDDKKAENDDLQKTLDSGDEAEYIERVARDSLGYMMPDEKVYYDTSSK